MFFNVFYSKINVFIIYDVGLFCHTDSAWGVEAEKRTNFTPSMSLSFASAMQGQVSGIRIRSFSKRNWEGNCASPDNWQCHTMWMQCVSISKLRKFWRRSLTLQSQCAATSRLKPRSHRVRRRPSTRVDGRTRTPRPSCTCICRCTLTSFMTFHDGYR